MKKTTKLFLVLIVIVILSCLLAACNWLFPPDIPDLTFYDNGFTYLEKGDFYEVEKYSGIADSVVIPSSFNGKEVVSIGEKAFAYDNLTRVVIPDTVTSIGAEAFAHCVHLKNLWIGSGVKHIEKEAFYDCVRLVEIYNKSPLKITARSEDFGEVGYFAKAIYTEPYSTKLYTDENGYTVYTDGDMVSLIEYIGEETDLVLPAGITEINNNAFYGKFTITSVTIPESVKRIGAGAFWLTAGTLGYDSRMRRVNYTGDIASWCRIKFNGYGANPLPYARNLYINDERVADLVIPDTMTSIESQFTGGSFASVTIPDSVTSIGGGAFRDCTSLASIAIPDSVTSIGDSAFENCSSLTNVVVGDGVTNIGKETFYNCSALSSVTIGRGMMRIGNSAFGNCISLKGVYYKGDVASWCEISFEDCFSNPLYYGFNLYVNDALVKDLVIPDTVTSIGPHAFQDGRCFTSITIGSGVTHIGNSAFVGCMLLTSITYRGTRTQWEEIEKGEGWGVSIGTKMIHCNDGDIEL